MNFYLCRRRQCSHAVSLTVWDDDGRKKESRMKKEKFEIVKMVKSVRQQPSRAEDDETENFQRHHDVSSGFLVQTSQIE